VQQSQAAAALTEIPAENGSTKSGGGVNWRWLKSAASAAK
jgi:hypothetical protein